MFREVSMFRVNVSATIGPSAHRGTIRAPGVSVLGASMLGVSTVRGIAGESCALASPYEYYPPKRGFMGLAEKPAAT